MSPQMFAKISNILANLQIFAESFATIGDMHYVPHRNTIRYSFVHVIMYAAFTQSALTL